MDIHHPIRDAKIIIYEKYLGKTDEDKTYVGWFLPASTYPVIAHGQLPSEVKKKLELIRSEAIEKYEKSYINREEGRRKAAETRLKKKQQ